MELKQVAKAVLPYGVVEMHRRYLDHLEKRRIEERVRRISDNRAAVKKTIEVIRALRPEQCRDIEFLERTFVPALGLNDERLQEQPNELTPYFGQGLHIWQYPSQLARYLVWISENASGINSYMEIGCRWGGMFILVSEWLRRNGATLETVAAIDPIDMSPFLQEYFSFIESDAASSNLKTVYLHDFSTSAAAKSLIDDLKPDFTFIDGDHSLQGALSDHMLVRGYSRIIVHHDIVSRGCPDVVQLWAALKQLETDFEKYEFVNQYDSVDGSHLGIGALKRRQ
jgi:hypothetical protein